MNTSFTPPEAAAPIRAAIYAQIDSRAVSTKSIEKQVEVCRAYIAEKGWVLNEVHARPTFQRRVD